ncbi:MAG: hypothetical protein ACPW61_13315 [Methyloligella sp. ZOD6]
MVLGDLLARFGDETTVTEAVLGLGNLRLLAALRRRADEEGMTLGAFTTQAVRRYAEVAPDEEWITMMGLLDRATDPSLAFIERALWRTTHDAI